MNELKVRSRYRGCLLAGAAGDALGYPVEFMKYDEIKKKYGSAGIGGYDLVFDREYAVITDDTQMTLFTAAGLLEQKRRGGATLDSAREGVYEAYLDWLHTQSPWNKRERFYTGLIEEKRLFASRAPGGTCLGALSGGKCGSVESPINHSKGCGGVMRVAPCGLFYGPRADEGDVLRLGALAAAITHGHPLGYLPGAALAYIVWRAVHAQEDVRLAAIAEDCLMAMQRAFDGEDMLDEFDRLLRRAMTLAKNDLPDVENIGALGEGWVGDEALAISLYCCLRHEASIADALIAAVNHDGDSDSTGAIAGNILGALHGEEAMDENLLAQLEMAGLIIRMADQLYDVSCSG